MQLEVTLVIRESTKGRFVPVLTVLDQTVHPYLTTDIVMPGLERHTVSEAIKAFAIRLDERAVSNVERLQREAIGD